MNFELNEMQSMLRDTVSRYISNDYDFEKRRQAVAKPEGFDTAVWSNFAELGWLSVPFAEEAGGMGGDAVDTMVLMEALGRGLCAEPWLPTVYMFGGLIQAAGGDRADALLSSLMTGELQGTFAWHERQSHHLFHDVETLLEKSADGYRLNGVKSIVLNGAAASHAVVSARSSGDSTEQSGISLVLVDLNSTGVTRQVFDYMDGQKVATVEFKDVALSSDALLGAEGEGLAIIAKARPMMIVAIAAEALGIIEHLNATTLEYTRTRKQFGKAIGSFQVLQHRQVDTFASAVKLRSMLLRTVCHLTDHSVDERDCEKDLAALKFLVGRCGRHVGGEAIQLHGGMGMTDELDIGHYTKRLLVLNQLLGDADYHLKALAAC